MKKKDLEALKTKTAAELKDSAKKLQDEIKQLSFEMAQRKVKNVNSLRTKMKERARVLTLLTAHKTQETVKEVQEAVKA